MIRCSMSVEWEDAQVARDLNRDQVVEDLITSSPKARFGRVLAFPSGSPKADLAHKSASASNRPSDPMLVIDIVPKMIPFIVWDVRRTVSKHGPACLRAIV